MQKKRLLLVVGVLIIVSVAAFVGGMLVNQKTRPVRLGESFGSEDLRSIILPAPELPVTPPEVIGAFIQRQDNNLTVEVKSLGMGNLLSTAKNQSAPQVEVVVTGGTLIYRETTHPSEPFSAENQTIQQTVEESTLDDLNSQAMITVWGRKSGDRIVAEVLMYGNMAEIKQAIFEDCEICP